MVVLRNIYTDSGWSLARTSVGGEAFWAVTPLLPHFRFQFHLLGFVENTFMQLQTLGASPQHGLCNRRAFLYYAMAGGFASF